MFRMAYRAFPGCRHLVVNNPSKYTVPTNITFSTTLSTKSSHTYKESYQRRPSHFPQKRRRPERNWNVIPDVQNRLRNSVFHAPEFGKTIFMMEYPLNITEERKGELEQFFGESPKFIRTQLEKTSFDEFKVFLQDVATSGLHDRLNQNNASILCEIGADKVIRVDIDDKLLLTDLLYQMGIISSKFMDILCQTLVTSWKSLHIDNSRMLQILFYIGVYRSAPATLLENIEAYLAENIDTFDNNQIGLICHSFFSCNRAIFDYDILHGIGKTVLSKKNNRMHIGSLCNVMKVMRHSKYSDEKFFTEVGNMMCVNQQVAISTNLPSLSNIASAYASARHRHTNLLDEIAERVSQLITDVTYNVRMKDLSRLLAAFQTLRFQPPQVILNELNEQLETNKGFVSRHPEIYTQSALALAMEDIYPKAAFKAIFSPKHLKEREGRSLEQHFQLLMLDSLARLEYPDEQFLSKEHLGQLRLERDMKKGFALRTRLGLAATWLMLEELLGGEDNVTCNYITDFSYIPDIKMLIDEEGRPMKVPGDQVFADEDIKAELREKFSTAYTTPHDEGIMADLLKERNRSLSGPTVPQLHIPPPQKSQSRKVTIKVLSHNQYLENAPLLLGLHQAELRFLSKLGYEVLTIPPQDALKVEVASPEDRRSLVQTLVLDKLGVKI